jgi:hypothetical protein
LEFYSRKGYWKQVGIPLSKFSFENFSDGTLTDVVMSSEKRLSLGLRYSSFFQFEDIARFCIEF